MPNSVEPLPYHRPRTPIDSDGHETIESADVAIHPLRVDPDVIVEGTASYAAEKAPFRGYWWPWNGSIYGAMSKYDSWVQARGITRPSALEWERLNHKALASWSGHCNGWAASSVLYKEPLKAVVDSGVTFNVSDIKALLASASFCVRFSFHGKRYRSGGNDPTDIDPLTFHRVLIDNLANRKRNVAVDVDAREGVDNNVISGGTWTVTKLNQANTYQVAATLRIHTYDSGPSDVTGTAVSNDSTYQYQVTTDANGRLVSGTWLSGNPDFLWVPLAEANCGRDNPHVITTDLDKLVESATRNNNRRGN